MELKNKEASIIEIREDFTNTCIDLIIYWDSDSRAKTSREKLEGLTHSILALIDGENGNLPGFIITPNTSHEEEYTFINNNGKIYPDNSNLSINYDLGGGLHNTFHRMIFEKNEKVLKSIIYKYNINPMIMCN